MRLLLIFIFTLTFTLASAQSMPRITHSYIELDKIKSVSRFRSGIGHNYSFDPAEPCRSMKHYFVPKDVSPENMPKIMSPVDGYIIAINPEWAGDKIDILAGTSGNQIRISLFHVNRLPYIRAGTYIQSGELLGTHVGSQTYSDIAIMDNTTGKLLSYFKLMADDVFAEFANYSQINVSRDNMIIAAEERNAHPLQCSPPPDEIFLSPGSLENWVYLK